MSNIEEELSQLQPYVVGIRYVDGYPVIDTLFTEGWILPPSERVQKHKGDEKVNYFMILRKVEGVGLDELLDYVRQTIKLNKDREEKLALLRSKVEELKTLFKANNLERLQGLRLVFGDEDTGPKLNEIDEEFNLEEETVTEPLTEPVTEPVTKSQTINSYLDENGKPIEMSPEELEEQKLMAEEDARAERNIKHTRKKDNMKVELPPRG